jgi:hypothetical protein
MPFLFPPPNFPAPIVVAGAPAFFETKFDGGDLIPFTSHELSLDAKGSDDPAGDRKEKEQRVAVAGERHRDKNRRTHCARLSAYSFQ